jgi:hypothetical protein
MPAIESGARYQDAVYWKASGIDRYGRETVDEPIPIKLRFELTKTRAPDMRGNLTGYDAQAVVDREMPIGSLLWLGDIDSLPGTALVPETDVMVVASMVSIPDIKGRRFHLTAMLNRRGDTLGAETA